MLNGVEGSSIVEHPDGRLEVVKNSNFQEFVLDNPWLSASTVASIATRFEEHQEFYTNGEFASKTLKLHGARGVADGMVHDLINGLVYMNGCKALPEATTLAIKGLCAALCEAFPPHNQNCQTYLHLRKD